MKKFIASFSLLALCGCMSSNSLNTASDATINVNRLSRVCLGMLESEVVYIMGKPYQYESYWIEEDVYDVWFYVTTATALGQTRMTAQNLTAVTFKNGHLASVGNDFYNHVKKLEKQGVQILEKKSSKEQREEEERELEKILEKTTSDLSSNHETSINNIELGMKKSKFFSLMGKAEGFQGFQKGNDVYEVYFYGNNVYTFKNGILVANTRQYFEDLKRSATRTTIDGYDQEAEQMIDDEGEQNFNFF